jgi:putative toxin-antitoxin system antitoxin component (TIGR02293 family)
MAMDPVLARAVEVLDDADKAVHWLTTPNRALGGVVPMTLLDTPEGREQVETILGRIEYGVYS